MKNAIIMGAAGRDFHNFNVFFRDNRDYKVLAFTATQIPDIEGRKYPSVLAGELYPDGIPIHAEQDLTKLIKSMDISEVFFSYSDIPHEYVMNKASQVQAAGASFTLLGPRETMIKSKLPVISVCAVRTGCGKSQTTRKISLLLKQKGRKVVVIRHPMPYGDLTKQAVQRFAAYDDLIKHEVDCLMISSGFLMVHQIGGKYSTPVAERRARILQLMSDFAGLQALYRDGCQALDALDPE